MWLFVLSLLAISDALNCSSYIKALNFTLKWRDNPLKLIKKGHPCYVEFEQFLTLNSLAENTKKMEKRFLSIKTNLKARAVIQKSIQKQAEFCANPSMHQDLRIEGLITLQQISFQGQTFKMYLYKNADIVSANIRGSGSYEAQQIIQLADILVKYKNFHKINKTSDISVLDIGANVGWYTIFLGLLGYKVIAVEPTLDNVYLIRKNLCMNPTVKALVLDIGVGNEEKNCSVYSDPINYGDSWVSCDGQTRLAYPYRGEVKIMKLDTFADFMEHIKAIKMDIEGYESFALEGGKSVFLNGKIPFILTEFTPHFFRFNNKDPYQFADEFINAGYNLSQSSFESGFLSRERVMTINQPSDLRMIHRDAWVKT